MENLTPKFYYAGNRHVKSDLPWITKQLSRLNNENREIACQEYENFYLRHFDGLFPEDRRTMANTHLLNFCNEFGISKEEFEKARKLEGKFKDKIEELKKLKPLATKKTILGMYDERNNRKRSW